MASVLGKPEKYSYEKITVTPITGALGGGDRGRRFIQTTD